METKQPYEQAGVAMTCRSFNEYERMFGLDDQLLLRGPILDVAGGASSFTAEANRMGYGAMAVDPLYKLSAEEIERHGKEETITSTHKLSKIAHIYSWDYYGSLSDHQKNREKALQTFVDDYRGQDAAWRYNTGELPCLPFAPESFSLILCSHFLFLYHDQFDVSFHERALQDLVRICRYGGEIRLYPLVTLQWEKYPHMEALKEQLNALGARTEHIKSNLPFIPGSIHFMRILK